MPNKRKRKKMQAGAAEAVQPAAHVRDADTAAWVPVQDPRMLPTAGCSACGFRIEAARAVETGWSATEYTALRYRFCPMCGRKMRLPENVDGAREE